MKVLGLNELRKLFEDFYVSKDHYPAKSFSLVPEDDKSLLLINSGMAPLKPFFAGTKTPPSKRMTTCQKCIRTGDIDNVGYTERHGTFFEMLGSFSFGDYFKKESIEWGWEFLTEVLEMDADLLWASVYEEDDEAYDIWKNVVGMPEEKIIRLGKEDNFWEIGTGPCGPCSEIYYDRGEERGCGSAECRPGCDCDRFVEVWNHVFTQFNKDNDGNYTPLKHKNIDTGMGLERLACVVQSVDSIFDVDTVRHILDQIVKVSGVEYASGKAKTDASIRIITDHIRSITFMTADGILPGNEGRSYVLRRLLRRAARHGKLLGIEGPFLADLTKAVIAVSGGAYPELIEQEDFIYKIIKTEEEKFSYTIEQGSILLEEEMSNLKKAGTSILAGDHVFKLYDTYGFPYELTEEILQENGYTYDKDGFDKLMEEQKEMARAARKALGEVGWSGDLSFLKELRPTVFRGYTRHSLEAEIVKIFPAEDDARIIILDETPFYAEGGGQITDIGTITKDDSQARVIHVSKHDGVYLHKVMVNKGDFKEGDRVTAAIDSKRRNNSARNHTVTHLLHKALMEVLGGHAKQAGSYVGPGGLHFDFSHFQAMSPDEIKRVEDIVNDKIIEFLDVHTEEMSLVKAKEAGAIANFGEKYEDEVRVVTIGDFSMELCGGTHVSNSGQIGSFKIISESGVAAGVRRIEAVTGLAVRKMLNESESLIQKASGFLKVPSDMMLNRLEDMAKDLRSVKKELEHYKAMEISSSADKYLANSTEIKGIRLIREKFENMDVDEMRRISDEIKAHTKEAVIVLASINENKVNFIVSVTDDLLDKGYHAGNMIKKIAAAAGGGGGGKADMAQAGGKSPEKIADAFQVAEELL